MNKGKLLPLYLSQGLRQFAISLFSLFSAIYIYKISGSLRSVFLFFLLFHLANFLAAFMAEEWALKSELRSLVRIGQGLMFFAILLLLFSEKSRFLLFIAPIAWGFSASFYWFGWYGLMAKGGRLGEYGRSLGWLEIFNLVPSFLSPILAGFLIHFYGYTGLFLMALVILFLSLFGLRGLGKEKTHYDTTPQEIWSLFKTHKRMVLAYFGASASATIYGISFPLYLFLILRKELSLGEFFSLSLIIVAVVNFLIGREIDKHGKRNLVASGSLLSYLVWLGRLLGWGVVWLFFLDVTDRVVEKMTSMPLEVLSYEKALNGATGRAILFRETAVELGAIFVCLVLLLIKDLRFSFVLGAWMALLPLLLIKKKGMYGDGW